MEGKRGDPSGAIPKRSNIPETNTKVKAKSESFRRGLNRQSSKSKLVKTAIVNPYNFTADSNAAAEQLGRSTQEEVNSAEGKSTPSPNETNRTLKGRMAVEHSMNETKLNKTSAMRYSAHCGISFLASPRKHTIPEPFAFRERLNPVRQTTMRTNADASGASTADMTAKQRALRRKVVPPSDAKSRVPLKERPSNRVQQNLADTSKTVLKDAPVLIEKFSGHSGMVFKPRKRTKPLNNPFANSGTAVPNPQTQHGEAAEK